MEFMRLGGSGLKVSSLCLGTMSFGGEADAEESARIYRRSREAGINFFDCADVYHGGASEELLGGLIQGERDKVVIATKAFFPTGDGPNDRGASPYHLRHALEASLRRLKTDRVDLFYLHRFDDACPLVESLRCVEDLRRQGKFLHLGVSNFAAWQVSKAIGVAELHRWAPLVAVQPMYNLVKRQAEVEILPMALSEGVAVVPYSPMGGGLLSGKYGRNRRPDSGRLVENPMYQTRYGAPGYYQVAEEFVALAQEVGVAPAALAVAWVGAHPGVTAPILGARSVAQLEQSLAAADVAMSAELYARISALSPTPPPATDRNEESSAHHYGAVLRR